MDNYNQKTMFEMPELSISFVSENATRNELRLARGENLEVKMSSYVGQSGVKQTNVYLRLGREENPEERHNIHIINPQTIYHTPFVQHFKPLTENPLEVLSILRKRDSEAYEMLKERATLQLRQALEGFEKELREKF